MRTKLLALVILSLVLGTGLGYSISMYQVLKLQSSLSELESKTSALATACNTLGTNQDQLRSSYNSLSANYSLLSERLLEKDIQLQLLQQQMNNLNKSYLDVLQQYEDLRNRTLQRETYTEQETQKVKIDAVPAGVRRHYILVSIPIPEDAGQDVALVHYDKNDNQLAVPFYYWMDVNANGKSVISSGCFPFPCQITEYRTGENSSAGVLYIQTIHTPTEQGYTCEPGDYLTVEFPTSSKSVADVTVVYWDEKI